MVGWYRNLIIQRDERYCINFYNVVENEHQLQCTTTKYIVLTLSVYCLYDLRHIWFLSLHWIETSRHRAGISSCIFKLLWHNVQIVVYLSSFPSSVSQYTFLSVYWRIFLFIHVRVNFEQNRNSEFRIGAPNRYTERLGAPHNPR